ncbi:hypothetical protein Scep_028540 [Stephania cephalantha]|uniref:Uncharacterized protein n=1 Tax=Stephania cephalantha TaxID=152367 RepID=A0AAP0HI85_9MAGN
MARDGMIEEPEKILGKTPFEVIAAINSVPPTHVEKEGERKVEIILLPVGNKKVDDKVHFLRYSRSMPSKVRIQGNLRESSPELLKDTSLTNFNNARRDVADQRQRRTDRRVQSVTWR